MSPEAIMSPDTRSTIVDVALGVVQKSSFSKSCQNLGVQLKPRIVAAIGNPCTWIEGTVKELMYLGFGDNGSADVCMHFNYCFSLSTATKDPHYLLIASSFLVHSR